MDRKDYDTCSKAETISESALTRQICTAFLIGELIIGVMRMKKILEVKGYHKADRRKKNLDEAPILPTNESKV